MLIVGYDATSKTLLAFEQFTLSLFSNDDDDGGDDDDDDDGDGDDDDDDDDGYVTSDMLLEFWHINCDFNRGRAHF